MFTTACQYIQSKASWIQSKHAYLFPQHNFILSFHASKSYWSKPAPARDCLDYKLYLSVWENAAHARRSETFKRKEEKTLGFRGYVCDVRTTECLRILPSIPIPGVTHSGHWKDKTVCVMKSLKLREEHRPKCWEQRIFGFKRKELIARSRQSHSAEHRNLCSSCNTVWAIMSGRMRWTGKAAHFGEKTTTKFWSQKVAKMTNSTVHESPLNLDSYLLSDQNIRCFKVSEISLPWT